MLTLQTKGVFLGPVSGIPISIDNMNPNNRFIQNLTGLPVGPGVTAHSIIAVNSDASLEKRVVAW